MTRPIKDYENYTINEDGEVFNTKTQKRLNGSIGEHGYKYYRLSKDGKKKMFYAHILVADAFIPNPDNLPIVNHKDGNKNNNHVSNLERSSYSDNVIHAHQNNLIAKGKRGRIYYTENLDGEEWQSIEGLPYSVSSMGRIRNDRTQALLRPSVTCGYYKVRPSVGGRPQDIVIHNIVYCVFNNLDCIPSGMVVNHINGNKLDNRLENLRLITLSENVRTALYETQTNKSCKAVAQYKDGKYIATYPSAREASRVLNLDASTISKVCRGINKSHGGFTFKYVEN